MRKGALGSSLNKSGPRDADTPMFSEGDLIGKSYRVVKKLGRGGYGEIFACVTVPSGERVAVKVERICRNGNLKDEEAILKTLLSCKYVPHLKSSSIEEDKNINYITMELFGENLSNLRRKQEGTVFSVTTTIMLARQMLRCIREVHNVGILHRDIKPGNFVIGTRQTRNPRTVIMIDYGLSRLHLDEHKKPKEKRATARWVGSRRYMSLNAHLRKDQGRRDDLWSLLYVLIEFRTGTLPWAHLRGVENLDKIRDVKVQYYNEKLVHGMPPDFVLIVQYIKSLKYESCPDYDFLDSILCKIFYDYGGNANTSFDWETPEEARLGIEIEAESGYNLEYLNEKVPTEIKPPFLLHNGSPEPSISAESSNSEDEGCIIF